MFLRRYIRPMQCAVPYLYMRNDLRSDRSSAGAYPKRTTDPRRTADPSNRPSGYVGGRKGSDGSTTADHSDDMVPFNASSCSGAPNL
jgi:hypothetical protein